MRPVQLAIAAFGPYLEPVQLDFRKLTSAQLFLIHGPVGAGKTTLLDAICFALYGTSSGGERSAQDMRNDLADPNVPSSVVFDFSQGPANYRVKRQLFGDVRGAQLWNLTGMDWPDPWTDPILPPLAVPEGRSPWDGVTHSVAEMLGLGSSEFRRSIIIPQGQFRQLLSSPPSEREQILSALFQTNAPQTILKKLEENARSTQERLKRAWATREELATEMQLESGEDVLDRLEGQRKTLQRLEVEMLRLQQQQQEFVADAGKAAVFQERSQELAAAEEQLKRLEAAAADQSKARESLSRFRAATALDDYRRQLSAAESDVERAEEEFRAAQQLASGQLGESDLPERSLEELRGLHELESELKSELERLGEAEKLNAAYEKACQQRDLYRVNLAELDEQMIALKIAIQECQERLDNLASQEGVSLRSAERTREIQDQLSSALRAQKRGKQQSELKTSVERLRVYCDKAGQRSQEVETRVATLEEEIARLESSRFVNQALFLAAQLQPGQPCLVCGSLEHPLPAHTNRKAESSGPSPRGFLDRSREPLSPEKQLEQKSQQLKQAQLLARKLEKERSDQAITLARLEARLETLQDDTLEAPSPDSASLSPQDIARLQDELRHLEREASQKGKEDSEKMRLNQRRQKLARTLSELEQGHREAELKLAQAEVLVEERSRLLMPGLLTAEQLEHNRQQVQGDLDAVQQDLQGGQAHFVQSTGELVARQAAVQAAERSLQMARERLRLAHEVYQARSEAAGFASLEEVAAAATSLEVPPDQVEADVRSHELEVNTARDRLDRARALYNESLEQSGALVDPQQLQQRLDSLVDEKSRCIFSIQELQDRSEHYQTCIEEIHSLEPQLNRWKRLLRVAQGENRAGLSLQQYVLARHMENVLLAANHRLAWMTRGRYYLQTAGKGLALEVRDQASGQVRPVATLSGGESFLASLALALGLCDSIPTSGSAQALEALFIDEGFGNLDEEALELALQGLTQLQHEGRIIGVVSHLPELRERIPVRLEVQSNPGGSRAHIVAR